MSAALAGRAVLVAGATGFIAGHLIPRLMDAGCTVFALGHDPGRLRRFPRATHLVRDLRDPAFAEGLPERVDVVVHLALANSPFPETALDQFAVSVGSVQRLLDYAWRCGAERFVLASTGAVYGLSGTPACEDDPPLGRTHYAATKLAAERITQAYESQLAHSVLRLFVPYGPGQAGRLVPSLIDRIWQGSPVVLRQGARPRFNPLYIAHVVDVFTQAIAAGRAQGHHCVNVAGDEVLSIADMAEAIGRVLDRTPVFERLEEPSLDNIGDTARLRRTFRLPDVLTSFEEGIRQMVASRTGRLSVTGSPAADAPGTTPQCGGDLPLGTRGA